MIGRYRSAAQMHRRFSVSRTLRVSNRATKISLSALLCAAYRVATFATRRLAVNYSFGDGFYFSDDDLGHPVQESTVDTMRALLTEWLTDHPQGSPPIVFRSTRVSRIAFLDSPYTTARPELRGLATAWPHDTIPLVLIYLRADDPSVAAVASAAAAGKFDVSSSTVAHHTAAPASVHLSAQALDAAARCLAFDGRAPVQIGKSVV
eukprot:TRINITY_DN14242_c0_g1_i1.p1 TRINITY_DN14242_c0_g1~~TRINITY_DN14242_c0_g1_i1.p1  ORF type:complete len:206 (+),score=27.11 TRINITY_DN14242_c0_g1_i1:213-830(+)